MFKKLEGIRNRRLNNGVRHAEAVAEIEIAFACLAGTEASADQLGDLADAIDAFEEGGYGVAASLARAAAAKRRAIAYSRRPLSMSASLVELSDAFGRCKRTHAA